MKFQKLLAVLLFLFTLYLPVNPVVKPETVSADSLQSCGSYSLTDSSNHTIGQLKLHQAFTITITPPAGQTFFVPNQNYLLYFAYQGTYYIVDDSDAKMKFNGTTLSHRFNGIDKGVPEGGLLYVGSSDDEDHHNRTFRCTLPVRVVDPSVTQTVTPEAKVTTCLPGSGASGGTCGNVGTAFGDFSGDPSSLANIFYDFALGIAGGLALIMMIYASIKMISSRGDPDALQAGKQLFTSAIIGLLVIIFAAFLIRLIGTGLGIPGISRQFNFSAYAVTLPGSNNTVNEPAGFKFSGGNIGTVVTNALPIVLFFAGVLAFIYLLFGGFKYMISRGDSKRLDNARMTISYAIIGLVIILGSYIILRVLQAVLKFNISSLIPAAYADVDLGSALGVRFATFGELFSALLVVVFPVAGVVFFFFLLWGGLRYMLSRGDDKVAGEARGVISAAVIGLLIILGSYIILKVIEGVSGIHIIG